MLARKFSSDGSRRCPTPCRARNATRRPRSIPSTYGPEGSPNGVAIVRSSRSVNSAMSYRPLPPMMPICVVIGVDRSSLVVRHWSPVDTARSVALAQIAGGNRRIVLEEHEHLVFDRFFHEPLLRRQRVQGI